MICVSHSGHVAHLEIHSLVLPNFKNVHPVLIKLLLGEKTLKSPLRLPSVFRCLISPLLSAAGFALSQLRKCNW